MDAAAKKKMEEREKRKLKQRRALAAKLFAVAAVVLVAFIIWILLVKTVDVQAIGPEGTKVGMAAMNGAFHQKFEWNKDLYNVSKILGILALLTAAGMAGFGVYQLIKRKSIKKVDRTVLATGGLYVVVGLLYIFFEKVVINYRPMIMEGDQEVEASFPSTHTMLACILFGSSIMILGRYLHKGIKTLVFQIFCGILMAVTVVARLFCGVHWVSDIIGGILISGAVLAAYGGVITIWRSKKTMKKKKKKPEHAPGPEYEI